MSNLRKGVIQVLEISFVISNCYYYMVDEKIKVFRSLNNTLYLVTGLFDQVISSECYQERLQHSVNHQLGFGSSRDTLQSSRKIKY